MALGVSARRSYSWVGLPGVVNRGGSDRPATIRLAAVGTFLLHELWAQWAGLATLDGSSELAEVRPLRTAYNSVGANVREHTPAGLYPEVPKARWLTRILCLKARACASAASPDEAIADLLKALRLGVKLQRGGIFIHCFTGLGCQQMAFEALIPMVAEGQVSGVGLRDLLAALGDVEKQVIPLREAIAFDYHVQGPAAKKLDAETFWELLGGSADSFLPLDVPEADDTVPEFVERYLPALREYDATLVWLSLHPYYEIRDQIPAPPEGLPPSDSMVLAPTPDGVLRRQAATLAWWRAARTAIHLALFRNNGGEYPQSLDELQGLTAEQLQDPFSGQGLIYRRQDQSYVLYSVGNDGQDNGGTCSPPDSPHAEGNDLLFWPQPTG